MDKDQPVEVDELYTCPVCGYPHMTEPAVDEYGCSTFYICPCCFVEFGIEDCNTSYEELRRRWLAAGAQWSSTYTKAPENWSAEEQLKQAELGKSKGVGSQPHVIIPVKPAYAKRTRRLAFSFKSQARKQDECTDNLQCLH